MDDPNPPLAAAEQIKQVAAAIKHAKRPVIYCGGGIIAGEAYVLFGGASGFGTVDGSGRQVIDLTSLSAASSANPAVEASVVDTTTATAAVKGSDQTPALYLPVVSR